MDIFNYIREELLNELNIRAALKVLKTPKLSKSRAVRKLTTQKKLEVKRRSHKLNVKKEVEKRMKSNKAKARAKSSSIRVYDKPLKRIEFKPKQIELNPRS